MIRTLWPGLIGLCLTGSFAFAAGNASLVMQGMAPQSNGGYTLREIRLNYAPDELTDTGAQASLHKRIQEAATTICRNQSGLNTPQMKKKVRACQSKTIRNALAELDLPSRNTAVAGDVPVTTSARVPAP